MRIAILSDIHDHIWNLDRILEHCQSADTLICCGDLCSPFIMARLGQNFDKEIHLVFGNNDADLFRISRIAQQFGDRVHLHGEIGEIELDGKRIAINHFDQIARPIAASGDYDVVCFGHNHQRECSRISTADRETLLINPGPVMGMKFVQGVPTPTESSYAVLETETMIPTFFDCISNQSIRILPV